MVTMAMTAITYDGDGDAGQPLIRMVPLMMVIMVMMALMMVMRIVIVIMVMIMVLPITLLPALYNPKVPYPMLQQRTIRIIQCYRSAQDSNGRPQRLSRLLHPRLCHNR